MSSHDYLTGVLSEIADLFPENPGEGLRAALAVAEAKAAQMPYEILLTRCDSHLVPDGGRHHVDDQSRR